MLQADLCLSRSDFLCVKPWIRIASALKAPFLSPWTMTALLVYYQPHKPCTPLFQLLPNSVHNRASFLDFNGPAPPTLAPNYRETDPTHGNWQRNSITGRVPRSKLFQFHVIQTDIVHWGYSSWNITWIQTQWVLWRQKRRKMTLWISVLRPLTKEADWDWPLLYTVQQTIMYLLHKLSLCNETQTAMTSRSLPAFNAKAYECAAMTKINTVAVIYETKGRNIENKKGE